MKKFFSKLLGKRRLEVRIAELEAKLASYEVYVSTLEQNEDLLSHELKRLRSQTQPRAKSVRQVNPKALYWVVSQGGYYAIKGANLLHNASEVTKRAYKNGFVVETEREAKALAENLRNIVDVFGEF